MGRPATDMTGQVFDRWTVLAISDRRTSDRSAYWWSRCGCGTLKEVDRNSLRFGRSRSCGCLTVEATRDRSGSKHPRWTGNYKQDYIDRRRFRQFRQAKVFERDDYTCQECRQRGVPLQVAHIKPWATHPALRFDLANCRTLCMACHYEETYGRPLPEGVVWGHNFNRRAVS